LPLFFSLAVMEYAPSIGLLGPITPIQYRAAAQSRCGKGLPWIEQQIESGSRRLLRICTAIKTINRMLRSVHPTLPSGLSRNSPRISVSIVALASQR
jgi:hypothetical protein